jgi:hypothetical protein
MTAASVLSSGCPLGNLIPTGTIWYIAIWQPAIDRLPRRTISGIPGRLCPLRASSCVLASTTIGDDQIDQVSIIERAFDDGWVFAVRRWCGPARRWRDRFRPCRALPPIS